MGARQKIVLGLGNPGAKYDGTRHNVGFELLDRIVCAAGRRWNRVGWWRPLAWVSPLDAALLAKPRTFMNRSGEAAAHLCRRYSTSPEDLIVAYDDADLALGRIKIRRSGGSGGHNGIRSLVEVLGTDQFCRVRLGVKGHRRGQTDLAHYVLGAFDASENSLLDTMLARAADAIDSALSAGVQQAMNRFNRYDPEQIVNNDSMTHR